MKCAILCSVLLMSLIQATWGNCSSSSKPDFKAPGRRISEEKCREYNWEKKCSSQDAELNKHPYLGAIAYKDEDGELRFSCNAILISPKFAVTAGHCTSSLRRLTIEFVRFGNKNLKDVPVIDAKIAKTILHPQYAAPRYGYDIALLEFESPLPVSRAVAPACLWSQPEITTNQNVQVSAWATTKDDRSHDILRTMTVQVIDSETCVPIVDRLIKPYQNRRFLKLEDYQLCANESDTINQFKQGSSGAPIVTSVPLGDGDEMPYVQAFANAGFQKVDIGIYVKISSFVDWIEQNVWS